MSKVQQVRQGDILLVKKNVGISKLKKIAENQYVLAYGEVTGHSHVMKGDVKFYDNGNGQILCRVKGKAELIHEEHEKIGVPEGEWLVVRQRELDLIEGIRSVTD
ncbi:MAG: hypothetical protein PHP08_00760 [Candidatus Dojkabacteria bacterium]|nr:hypothetical protein [Candidatus Dojkabacteria bacterium]